MYIWLYLADVWSYKYTYIYIYVFCITVSYTYIYIYIYAFVIFLYVLLCFCDILLHGCYDFAIFLLWFCYARHALPLPRKARQGMRCLMLGMATSDAHVAGQQISRLANICIYIYIFTTYILIFSKYIYIYSARMYEHAYIYICNKICI